ncbi:MAG: Dabb family protein [Clostridia bacterium]
MIKHIVCFKLNNQDDIKKSQEILLSMKGKVPQIIDIQANVDVLHSARSYDIILEVTLKDLSTLAAYQQDPYHCDVVKEFIHKVTAQSIAIDYQI